MGVEQVLETSGKTLGKIIAWPFTTAWEATVLTAKFVISGAALMGLGVGIKSWFDGHQQREQSEAARQNEESNRLRQHIDFNRAAMAEEIAKVGEVNPKSNFAASIRPAQANNRGQAASSAAAPVIESNIPTIQKLPTSEELAAMAGRNS